jgi:hypothetical protein
MAAVVFPACATRHARGQPRPQGLLRKEAKGSEGLVKAGHVMFKILNISEYLTFQTGGAGHFDFIKHGRAKGR